MIPLLLVTQFDLDADIIDCPPFIVGKAEFLQKSFWRWLFDQNLDHPYGWREGRPPLTGCTYRADVFVDWLNRFHLKNHPHKASLIQQHVGQYNPTWPVIYF